MLKVDLNVNTILLKLDTIRVRATGDFGDNQVVITPDELEEMLHRIYQREGDTGKYQVVITPEEWQEFRTASNAAMQANPDLVAKHKKLEERMRGFIDKLNVAAVKADLTIAPIITKIEAQRQTP